MYHLGDISKINGAEIEPVDVITFGSPCQDLSLAGKRAGIKHEANGDEKTTRSGLFMEAVRIIKEMREATDGKYPTFALWENVPGAFSSNKGEDFRTVLEELIKIVEPSAVVPEVPPFGWAYADSYVGDGWSLAYRTLDAQYWGVPQRRRRIHLVLDLRGQRARQVLFEREGLRGHPAKSGTQGQGTAPDIEGSPGAASEISYTATISQMGGQWERCVEDHINSTLCAGGNIAVVYCLQGNGIDRADTAGCNGKGWREGESYTLNTIDRPAVVYSIDQGGGKSACNIMKDGTPTLTCTHGAHAVVYQDKVGSLCARDYKGAGNQYVEEDKLIIEHPGGYIVRRLTPTECARLQGFADRWGDINEKEDLTEEEYRFWLDVRNTHAAINGKTVKDYTKAQMLTWYNKLHTDGAEYKMWGNGVALPTALYCMQGIADALMQN